MAGIHLDFISSGCDRPFCVLFVLVLQEATGFCKSEEVSVYFEFVFATVVRDGDGVPDGVAAFAK
jgi:hypothetical protein